MRAAVYHRPLDVRIEGVPAAASGPPGAVEAAGAEGSVTGIIPALARRGKVVVVAIHSKALERFNPTALLRQETEIVGSLAYDDDDDAIKILIDL